MDVRVIYVGAQILFGILFVVLLFLRHATNREHRFDKLDLLYLLFLVTIALDCIWRVIDGVPAYRSGHVVLEVVYLCTMAFTGYVWFLYTLDLFPTQSLKIKKYRFALGIPVLFSIVLIVGSLNNGLVFQVDEQGTYIRGSLSMVPVVINYVYMLLGSYVALKCRKHALLEVERRWLTAAAFFPVPVLLFSGVQMLLPPGLPSMQAGVLVGFLLVYGMSRNAMISQDFLTDLPNRFTFEQDLQERIHKFRKSGQRRLYLIEGDLNKFKQINDTYGHPEGDKVLKQTAWVLSEVFTPYGIAVFRTGGDEFMMIAETETELNFDSLQDTLNESLATIEVRGRNTISMCLGVEEYDGEAGLRTFVERVDKKLYEAKAKLIL